MEFELIRQLLGEKLSDFEKELLSLPEVLQKEINSNTDPGYIKFLTHIRDSIFNYFSTPVDKTIVPDIQWIDSQFALDAPIARQALADLRANLFNTAAVENLQEKLREAGAFGQVKTPFYFWHTSPYNWDDMSYQMRPVEWNDIWQGQWFRALSDRTFVNIKSEPLTMPNNRLQPQYGALGNFTINAIPEGYVEPKGNGKYDICVQKMYYFINDSFNFEGFEELGPWRVNKANPNTPGETDWRFLRNKHFRDITRHGYGREFPVLSRLHEFEDFTPHCLEYEYEK